MGYDYAGVVQITQLRVDDGGPDGVVGERSPGQHGLRRPGAVRSLTAATRRRMQLAVAFGAAAILATTSLAGASHPRPKGATPLRVPLVTAYNQRTASNRTHGPPLAFPACNPPAQTSTSLTVGTPDANGAAANSAGHVLIEAHPMTDENITATGKPHGRALQSRVPRQEYAAA